MDATKKSVPDTVNTSARMINAWFVEDVSRGRIRIIFGIISKNTLKKAKLIAKPGDLSMMNFLIASTAERSIKKPITENTMNPSVLLPRLFQVTL